MYISIKDNYRIIKKKVDEIDGKSIYRDLVEVKCKKCNSEFLQEIIHDVDGKLKIMCPICMS